MKTEELIGLFVIGSLKTDRPFLGVVTGVDDEFIYLFHKGAKKFISIAEIAEMKAEEPRIEE